MRKAKLKKGIKVGAVLYAERKHGVFACLGEFKITRHTTELRSPLPVATMGTETQRERTAVNEMY